MNPAVQIDGVVKNYSGLRPLRLASLHVGYGERIAVSGLDAVAAELFVNLVIGAALPDEGTVRTLGAATADISNGDDWLASLDRFGIVSPRAVLLEAATVQQNLAMPFSLQIDPVPAEIAARVAALARECGLADHLLSVTGGELSPADRVRVHLARAVALDPQLLVLEHPTAQVADSAGEGLGRDVANVAGARQLTAIAVTQDGEFAKAMAHRLLVLQPATGALVPWKLKKGWFR